MGSAKRACEVTHPMFPEGRLADVSHRWASTDVVFGIGLPGGQPGGKPGVSTFLRCNSTATITSQGKSRNSHTVTKANHCVPAKADPTDWPQRAVNEAVRLRHAFT